MKKTVSFFQDRTWMTNHCNLAKLKGIDVKITGAISEWQYHYVHEGNEVLGMMFSVDAFKHLPDVDVIRFEHFYPKELDKFHAIKLVGERYGEVYAHGALIYKAEVPKRWSGNTYTNQQQTFPRNSLTIKTYDHNFEVGDIVTASRNTPLRCGSGWYSHAIVIQSKPLVLVSEGADMRWSATVNELDLTKVGVASHEVLEKCMTRLEK